MMSNGKPRLRDEMAARLPRLAISLISVVALWLFRQEVDMTASSDD